MNNRFLYNLIFIVMFSSTFCSFLFSFPLDSDSFSNVIQNTASGVVSIKAYNTNYTDPANSYFTASSKDISRQEPDSISLGSGFIINITDTTIYILTTYHVVSMYNHINIIFYNGVRYPSKLYKYDKNLDLAILTLDYSKESKKEKLQDIKVLTLEHSNTLNKIKPGDIILTIGNQNSFMNTASVGIVSFVGRKLKNHKDLIQMDIKIDSGNSGSPILNLDSKVIGISLGINNNLSFAIPTKTIATFLSKIKY